MNPSIFGKLALLMIVSGAFMTDLQAQAVIGIKAGVNFATLGGSDASGLKNRTGFVGGFLVNAPLSDHVSLQPEAVYSGEGANAYDNSLALTTSYINIPLLLKITDRSGVFAELGPQVGLLMSARVNSQGTSADVKSAYKSTDFSFAFGLGYYSGSSGLGFDFRFNLGLTNIEDNSSSLSQGGSVKNNVIQLTMFYLFNNKD